jgi:hypothetical protein
MQRKTTTSLCLQKRRGNPIVLLMLALPPLVHTLRVQRRLRIRHRLHRQHYFHKRVGGRPRTPGMPCSICAWQVLQDRESPPRSCVPPLHETLYPYPRVTYPRVAYPPWTHTRRPRNPYPCPRVRVLAGTGTGPSHYTHGLPAPNTKPGPAQRAACSRLDALCFSKYGRHGQLMDILLPRHLWRPNTSPRNYPITVCVPRLRVVPVAPHRAEFRGIGRQHISSN